MRGRSRPSNERCRDLTGHSACHAFYETDTAGKAFSRCVVDHATGRCGAAIDAVAQPCSVEATLARCRTLANELRAHAEALRRSGRHAYFEEATVSAAEVFELAILQDDALPVRTSESVLASVLARADPFGWVDPPQTAEDVATQLPIDEAAGLESVLVAAIAEARKALARPPNVRLPLVPPSRMDLRVSDGYFVADGAPVMLTGFNAVDHHLSIDSVAQIQAGTTALPPNWDRRLRSLGVSVISLLVPLSKLLDASDQLNHDEAALIVQHLEWAAANRMAVVLHVSHYMPEWATKAHADLAMSEEEGKQHGVHYDIGTHRPVSLSFRLSPPPSSPLPPPQPTTPHCARAPLRPLGPPPRVCAFYCTSPTLNDSPAPAHLWASHARSVHVACA